MPRLYLAFCLFFFLGLASAPVAAKPRVTQLLSNTYTTAQAGVWNNTTTWVGGHVPALNDLVVINHVITIEANRVEQAFAVRYGTGGRLLFGADAQLRLGSDPCTPITADPVTILTSGTWRINEHRSNFGNVLNYYKRGAPNNTINFDNSYYITFNANGTGTNTNTGTPASFTWSFQDPERTKIIFEQQTVYTFWENIVFAPGSLAFTEYSTNNNFTYLAQIRRGLP
ncbi:hypothetical protein ACAW74_23990 [Fibrella sp. WM1]|uniref:hypothetical protein n=1 Tax=Fibrella musci TaxID=3242485 RepID=UPI00352081A3